MSKSSIWPTDRGCHSRSQIGAAIPGHSRTASDSKERFLHIPQRFWAEASTTGCLMSHQDSRWSGVLPLSSDAVGVFYSPSRLCCLDRNEYTHTHIYMPGCNGYRGRKWTRWHELKTWTRLIKFLIALIPLRKVWIKLFSLQLWVNNRTDYVLQLWWSN